MKYNDMVIDRNVIGTILSFKMFGFYKGLITLQMHLTDYVYKYQIAQNNSQKEFSGLYASFLILSCRKGTKKDGLYSFFVGCNYSQIYENHWK